MNHLEIKGKLIRDIEPKTRRDGTVMTTAAGNTVWKGTIVDQHSKRREDCSYFNFIMYGDEGKLARDNYPKGTFVCLKGWIKQSRWHDGHGQRSYYEVRVLSLEPMFSKDSKADKDDTQLLFGEDDAPETERQEGEDVPW